MQKGLLRASVGGNERQPLQGCPHHLLPKTHIDHVTLDFPKKLEGRELWGVPDENFNSFQKPGVRII